MAVYRVSRAQGQAADSIFNHYKTMIYNMGCSVTPLRHHDSPRPATLQGGRPPPPPPPPLPPPRDITGGQPPARAAPPPGYLGKEDGEPDFILAQILPPEAAFAIGSPNAEWAGGLGRCRGRQAGADHRERLLPVRESRTGGRPVPARQGPDHPRPGRSRPARPHRYRKTPAPRPQRGPAPHGQRDGPRPVPAYGRAARRHIARPPARPPAPDRPHHPA